MHTLPSAIVEQCTTSQLKALLNLATSPPDESAALLTQATTPDRFLLYLTELCGGEVGAGELLVETVSAHSTPIEALKGVKELAKKLLSGASTQEHRYAATFLYHATVAAAFGRYGLNISTYPIEGRLGLYEDFATALETHQLGEVFREAVDRVAQSGKAAE